MGSVVSARVGVKLVRLARAGERERERERIASRERDPSPGNDVVIFIIIRRVAPRAVHGEISARPPEPRRPREFDISRIGSRSSRNEPPSNATATR